MTTRAWRNALAELARDHGGTVEVTRANHLAIRLPNGERVITSGTPSDWRALANTRSNVRRAARAREYPPKVAGVRPGVSPSGHGPGQG